MGVFDILAADPQHGEARIVANFMLTAAACIKDRRRANRLRRKAGRILAALPAYVGPA